MLISREQNISDAHELFKALGETNTTLNVFFWWCRSSGAYNWKNAIKQSSHPINNEATSDGNPWSRRESVYQGVRCKFIPSASTHSASAFTESFQMLCHRRRQVQKGDPEVLRQRCIIRYDKRLYEGIILAADETHVQVKCLHWVEPNSFFLPFLMCLSSSRPWSLWHLEIQKISVGQAWWKTKGWSDDSLLNFDFRRHQIFDLYFQCYFDSVCADFWQTARTDWTEIKWFKILV